MLMLLFQVGNNSYAIESSLVVEVIPRVPLRKIHQVPDYVAGLFNYRGAIAPVIDLCLMIQGTPSSYHLSTRIMMVKSSGEDAELQYLGLMAERVIKTLDKSETELANSPSQINQSPYLGGIILDKKGMIQLIRLERLLADAKQFYLSAIGEENDEASGSN